jgi:curli biogenesis system outer membrane secretion channel CsgG
MNADPIQPAVFLQKSIDSLKAWVPSKVIEVEMKKQIAQAQHDHYVLNNKLDDKLILLPFANNSTYQGEWNIQAVLTEYLGNRLKSAMEGLQIAVKDSTVTDAIAAGESEKARFVLVGDIRGFEVIQRGEISVSADAYKEYSLARIMLHIELIDVSARKVVFQRDIAGEVSGKLDDNNTWKHLSSLAFNMADKKFNATILGQAVEQAAEQSTSDLSRYLKK